MWIGLISAYFALSLFDAWLTRRRVNDYGLYIETNPVIVWLSLHTNPEIGIGAGIFIPTVAIVGASLWLSSPALLAFFIGMRAKAFFYQVSSLKFESELGEFRAELDKQFLGEAGHPSAGSPSSDDAQVPPEIPSKSALMEEFHDDKPDSH